MKEKEQIEDLLHRYRAPGLIVLCVLMAAAGSLQMEKEAVETGSRDVGRAVSVKMLPEDSSGAAAFTGSFAGTDLKAEEILKILEKYHTRFQIELCEEKKDGCPVKWKIEYEK